MAKDRNPNQITRVDGKNVFFEVMNNCFSLGEGKVQINFVEYDPNNNNKQTKLIPIYMDFQDFLIIAQDVKSGRIAKYQADHKNDQYPYIIEEYTLMGGTSAKKLKEKGQERPDGKSLSRQFKLVVGKKFIFQAEMGVGHENEKGLIVPDYKTNTAEAVVRVPMDAKALKGMILLVEKHIEAYISKGYMNGNYDYKKGQNK